jgi:peptidyl-prolyl cis-trans isomerase C
MKTSSIRIGLLIMASQALFATSFAVTASPSTGKGGLAPPSSTDVLVKGKGVEVNGADFQADMERIPKDQRAEFLTSEPRIERALNRIFYTKAIAAAARDSDFAKDPDIAARLKYAADRELHALYSEHLKTKIEPPNLESRAREHYVLNESQYLLPEKVGASHILIHIKGRGREAALARAKEVRAAVVMGNSSFEELALKYSDDSSVRGNKGDLNYFDAKTMIGEFTKAAWALTNVGDISEPVETQFGFHIIRLNGRKPSEKVPYDKVKAEILSAMEEQFRLEELKRRLDAIANQREGQAVAGAIDRLKVNIDHEALKRAQQASEKGQRSN